MYMINISTLTIQQIVSLTPLYQHQSNSRLDPDIREQINCIARSVYKFRSTFTYMSTYISNCISATQHTLPYVIVVAAIIFVLATTGSRGEYLGSRRMIMGSREGFTMRNFIFCTVHLTQSG